MQADRPDRGRRCRAEGSAAKEARRAGGYVMSAARMACRRLRRLAGAAAPAGEASSSAVRERRTGAAGAARPAGGAPGRALRGEAPLISVVVPVYNALRSDAGYLRQALDSVAAQTYPRLELVVVDDGSTDGSIAAVDEFAAAHAELKLRALRQANGGQSSARNLGASVAGGEWLAFLDQDDVWLPQRLDAVAGLLRDGTDLVYTDADIIAADGTVEIAAMHATRGVGGAHPKRTLEEVLYQDVFVLPGTMTIRRSFFERLGGFDERLSGYEDDDLVVRAVEAGTLAYLPVPTLEWRMYDGNYSLSHRMVSSRLKYWDKLVRRYGADAPAARRLTLRFFRECLVQCTGQADAGDPLARSNLDAAEALARSLGPVDRAAFALTRWAWLRHTRAAFLARWWFLGGLEPGAPGGA